MAKTKQQKPSLSSIEKPSINSEQQKIVEWLKKVRFKKQPFGGVSEADVWRKIDELNKLYDAALMAERIRYETLLEEIRSGDIPAGERVGDEQEE